MFHRLLISLFVVVISCQQTSYSQDVTFVEQFALADDREKVLQQLVPGTQDYYYFHCLHYQNTQQFEKVDEMLRPWVRRFGETNLVWEIRNRQALLNYGQNPQQTNDYLADRLGLRFNHQRRIPAAQRGLPTTLDQNLISYRTLYARTIRQRRNTDGFEDQALEKIANQDLTETQLRHLLQRLRHPDIENLPNLIAKDLQSRNAKPFGSYEIHKRLVRSQLDTLLKLRPRILNEQAFVNIYLTKLAPGNDVNWRFDETAHRDYLMRLWEFVSTLDPVHNSLKANMLFRRLELDRNAGVYDKDRFVEYLKLPRQVFYINQRLIKNIRSSRNLVNLSANYQQQTRLRPIGTDEPLVRHYLHHFLKDASDYKEFLPWVRDNYLRQRFAETKIVNGLGDKEQWASLLSPEQYRQLMKRVDLDFVSTNPKFHQLDEKVQIEVVTKNVSNLIVKVFEINAVNYYRKHQREIDTDINLDGLIPNWQQSYQYDDPPALRVSRKFEFDQIDHNGIFVIDFIGNGKSSRALVRKGRLHHLVETTIAGQRFTILNESKKPVVGASLWIAGRQFESADDGTIIVPFSTQPKRETAIIVHENLAALASFVHQSEQYQLRAGLYVDRESLIRSGQANLEIRPQLLINGIPAPLQILSDIRLSIRAVDLDGVSATKEYKDLKLDETGESTLEFQVPPRLEQISFTLTATAENVSQNDKNPVSASQTFAVNQIDKSDFTQAVHLKQNEDGYELSVRGKSGEARSDQAVLFKLKHQLFKQPVHVTLRTDKAGQIQLGELVDIAHVEAVPTNGQAVSWILRTDRQVTYRSVNAAHGDTVNIPYRNLDEQTALAQLSLFEVRGGTYITDLSESIEYQSGLISLKDLAAGDYELFIKPERRSIYIRVTKGQSLHGYALGMFRDLEVRNPQPLHVDEINTDESGVKIRLGGDTQFARVHVFATRYEPRFDSFAEYSVVRDVEPNSISRGVLPNAYVAGRSIGEEYRYILDRRFGIKFPGNMLTRPSLLLNPWAIRTTENTVQVAQSGDDFSGAGGQTQGQASRSESENQEAFTNADFANLDFLASGTAILRNLKPDEKGVVSIDREKFGDKQLIQIIVQDHRGTLSRRIALGGHPLKFRDLRLSNALDPDQHFAQRKEYDVLKTDQSFELNDVLSGKFQHYDDLGDVFRYYLTLTSNPQLAEFSFLLQWPNKTDEEKRELYLKYACHELHFFLLHKDPDFFRSAVLPYLANKLNQTYLDGWLLEKDLNSFAEPWDFARLNTVEQILLGRRLTGHRDQLNRHILNDYELNPTTRQQFDQLFGFAVLGSALDRGGVSSYFEQTKAQSLELLDESRGELLSRAGENDPNAARGRYGAMDNKNRQLGEARAGGNLRFAAPQPPAAAAAKRPDGQAAAGLRRRSAADKSVRKLAKEKGIADMDMIATEALVESEARLKRSGLFKREGKKIYGEKELNQLKDLRKQVRQLYRRLKPTQEWVENNYYHLPIEQQTSELVRVNRYWRDYALHTGDEPFLSPYFAEASRNLTEMLLALAVLDLPFEAPEHEFDYADNNMTLVPKSNLIAFYQQIRPAVFDRRESNVLVSENFFRRDDRYKTEDGKKYDKFVTKEFLAHVLYGGQVVITNPTSTPQDIDLLIQIPAGAIPAAGSQETRTIQMDLNAFSTKTLEYYFYFPASGDFTHYPAHVSIETRVVAVADPLRFNVVDEPSEIDTQSWAFVSQNGTDAQVIDFLQTENLQNINLVEIAFRMKDADFFRQVIDLLASRFAYDHTLWSYAIKHNETDAITQYLKNAEAFLRLCGSYLNSELIVIDPVTRRWYEHREFWPLVNARAHQLGPRRKILNQRIWQQYHTLMDILARRTKLDDDDQLAATYYLLLQDRIEEAISHFDQVDPNKLETTIQYDYCSAYVALYKEQVDTAYEVAQRYKTYPVKRWRDLFQTVLAHVDEIRGGGTTLVDDKNQSEQQTKLASKTPSFDFNVESRKTKITYQNLQRVTANYYQMDVELLFSRNPFVQRQTGGFAMIKPNFSQVVELPGGKNSFEFDLPGQFENSNVLVELVGAGITKSQAYYANSLDIQTIEQYGQLRVTEDETKKPLSKVYVKVYARKADGSVHFYKDGYSDLRGRFDYASLSNQKLDDVERFAILVMSDVNGAVVREADVPKE